MHIAHVYYYNGLSSFLSLKVSAALGFFQQISASESSSSSSTGKELSDAECKQAGFNRLATNSSYFCLGRKKNPFLLVQGRAAVLLVRHPGQL